MLPGLSVKLVFNVLPVGTVSEWNTKRKARPSSRVLAGRSLELRNGARTDRAQVALLGFIKDRCQNHRYGKTSRGHASPKPKPCCRLVIPYQPSSRSQMYPNSVTRSCKFGETLERSTGRPPFPSTAGHCPLAPA